MGRRAKGFKVVEHNSSPYLYVRFTWKRRRYYISTGETDRGAAHAEAEKIYSDTVSGRSRTVDGARRAAEPLHMMFGAWLASLENDHDSKTVETYELYSRTHWLPFFRDVFDIDEARVGEYTRARLGKVKRKTVQKERGALRGFLGWCKEQGAIVAIPTFPEINKRAHGKRSGPQRETAPSWTLQQVSLALDSLPEASGRISKLDRYRFPVRARFLFAYETGLRPATLDELLWSDVIEDFNRLVIRDEVDKNRYGRTLPLTPHGRAILRGTWAQFGVTGGPIFGRHDYRIYLARAATAAGLPSLAAYDFRHARGTHMVEAGSNLPGVAFLLGHRQVTTTNKYVHPSERAAVAALLSGSVERQDVSVRSGAQEGNRTPTRVTPLEPESGERGTEPREKGSSVEESAPALGQESREEPSRRQNSGSDPQSAGTKSSMDGVAFAKASEMGVGDVTLYSEAGETLAHVRVLPDDESSDIADKLVGALSKRAPVEATREGAAAVRLFPRRTGGAP